MVESHLESAVNTIDSALHIVATEDAPSAERLRQAWTKLASLTLIPANYDRLPATFRDEFTKLRRAMESNVALDPQDIRSEIHRIIRMYDLLQKAQFEAANS